MLLFAIKIANFGLYMFSQNLNKNLKDSLEKAE